MPILNIHLVEGTSTPEQDERLLTEASRLYADVLGSPLDRVRAYVTVHPPSRWATGGRPVSQGGEPAPYFTAIVLAGRPMEQRQQLLAGFTDLIVEVLGVPKALVRGRIIPVDPDDWGIGGAPASVLREEEIRARAEATPG